MELLYVWIEDYNNIHHQGFNFSPKHRFHFAPAKDEDGKVTGGTLTHEEINPNYPDNFFGEHISNITAIVGKNGSGKSSLIEFLLSFDESNRSYIISYYKFIIITKDQESVKYKCYSSLLGKQLKHSKHIIFESKSQFQFKGVIYYSSSVNQNRMIATDATTVDISSNNLIDLYINSDKSKSIDEDSLSAFRYNEIRKQVDFMLDSRFRSCNINSLLGFKPPKEITLTISFNFKQPITRTNISDSNNYDYYYPILPNKKNNNLLEQIIYYSLYSHLGTKEESLPKYSQVKNQIDYEINEKGCSPIEICRILNNGLVRGTFYCTKTTTDEVSYNYGLSIIYSIESNPTEFEKLLSEKNHWLKIISPIIEWRNLSDGEAAFFSLISRIRDVLEKWKAFPIHYIILDEPDARLHPEWHQNLITRFKHFLELLRYDNIALILTTHSPILVSDLPRENIIFLDKDAEGKSVVKAPQDMERTFGANIHSLYRSSFFMNGVMGKFAEEKIQEVLDCLNGTDQVDEVKKKKVRFIIDQIGEPLIREMLLKKYDMKFHFSVEDRIEALEKEIVALKAKRDDTN